MAEDDTPQSDRSSQWVARLLVSLVLIAGILAAAGAGFAKLQAMRPPAERLDSVQLPLLVRATVAKSQHYREVVRAYGVAKALRRAQAIAQIDGRVVEVGERRLEVGDRVQTHPPNGSSATPPILVRLDDRDIRDRIERATLESTAAHLEVARIAEQAGNATSQLELAREERATAQREYERIQPLVPKTLSPSDLDRQRLQVTLQERRIRQLEGTLADLARQKEAATARAAASEKAVALEERNLEWTTVPAPCVGVVTQRAVEVGDVVRRGDVLFELVDLSRTQVAIALPAGRYDDVGTGSAVALLDPATRRSLWAGAVARRAPGIDPASRTFHVFVEIEGTPFDNPIPPGRHVLAEVRGPAHTNVFVVPRQAFLDGRLFVASVAKPSFWAPQRMWLAGLPHTESTIYEVRERTPTVSRWLPGVGLVTAGLADGERLLTTNLESVGDGGTVRLTVEDPDEQ